MVEGAPTGLRCHNTPSRTLVISWPQARQAAYHNKAVIYDLLFKASA